MSRELLCMNMKERINYGLRSNIRTGALRYTRGQQGEKFFVPAESLPQGSPRISFSSTRPKRAAQISRSGLTKLTPWLRPRSRQAPLPLTARPGTARVSVDAHPAEFLSSSGSDSSQAVARLSAVEKRLGYVFNDKSLGLNVIKHAGHDVIVTEEGRRLPFKGYKRLALLGDRVLKLVLCRTWYESAQSRQAYSHMEDRLVSRIALAATARKVGLEHNIFMKLAPQNVMAESFEALVGAIYTDSQYDLEKVQAILDAIDLKSVDTPPIDASTAPSRALPERISKSCHLSPSSQEEPNEDTVSVRLSASMGPNSLFHKKEVPHIIPVRMVLSDANERSREKGQCVVRPKEEKRWKQISASLYNYQRLCRTTVDLLSCFPELQNRYTRLFDDGRFGERFERDVSSIAKRRSNRVFVNNVCPPGEGDIGWGVYLEARRHALLHFSAFYFRATGKRWPHGERERTLFEVLRELVGLQPRDAFLTACWLEEQTRDCYRRKAGLPDWYDVPEHQNRALPPWRIRREPEKATEETDTSAGWLESSDPRFSYLQDLNPQQDQPTDQHQVINSSSQATANIELGRPSAPTQLASECSTPEATAQKEQGIAPVGKESDNRDKAPLHVEKHTFRPSAAVRNIAVSRTTMRKARQKQRARYSMPQMSNGTDSLFPTDTAWLSEEGRREQSATQEPSPINPLPDSQRWNPRGALRKPDYSYIGSKTRRGRREEIEARFGDSENGSEREVEPGSA